MIQIVIMIFAEIIAIGVSGALLTYMYHVCLEDGMILGRLGNWLRELAEEVSFAKPLGACPYCASPYITGIMALLYIYAFDVWSGIFLVVIGFFIIGIIDRYGML